MHVREMTPLLEGVTMGEQDLSIQPLWIPRRNFHWFPLQKLLKRLI